LLASKLLGKSGVLNVLKVRIPGQLEFIFRNHFNRPFTEFAEPFFLLLFGFLVIFEPYLFVFFKNFFHNFIRIGFRIRLRNFFILFKHEVELFFSRLVFVFCWEFIIEIAVVQVEDFLDVVSVACEHWTVLFKVLVEFLDFFAYTSDDPLLVIWLALVVLFKTPRALMRLDVVLHIVILSRPVVKLQKGQI
jgi:hypothetical protein